MTEYLEEHIREQDPTPQELFQALMDLGFKVQALTVKNYGDTFDLRLVPDRKGNLISSTLAKAQNRREARELRRRINESDDL